MRLELSGDRPRIDLDSLDLVPTPHQRRALAHDRDLAVTAGAGAGKTQTLSLRYAILLLELAADAVRDDRFRPRPDIARVLVLTFTEKAAEEMADRCYRRLLALADAVRAQRRGLDLRYGEGFGLALAAAVDHLLDTSDRASIHTFHGFCARILREFPSETRTPPGFEVLEEADAVVLREEAIDEALRGLGEGAPEALTVLLDAFGRRQHLAGAVRIALAERDRLLPRLRAHASGEVSLDEQVAGADPPPEAVRAWLADEAAPLLEALAVLLEPGGSDFLLRVVQPLRGRLERLPDDPLACNAFYAEVLEALVQKDHPRVLTHHSVMGARAGWGPRAYRANKDALERLQAGLADWPQRLEAARTLPVPADCVLLRTLAALSRLVLAAIGRQQARFDARRALDFSELQVRAVGAVTSDPALRRRLAGRYRWVMVDEFQDTDEAQWSLVRALGRVEGVPADRLFVVGDAKQSIYGFRGSDVTVFDSAARDLGVAPVDLPDNFRSRDELIAWFNDTFRDVLGEADAARPAWEAPYAALAPARGRSGGSIALVTHAANSAAEAAAREAEGVARLIGAEILPGRGAYAGMDLLDHRRWPEPPVAILLQRRTWLSFFERALREHGIPHVVARGVGFWARQEVLDLVNTLHALATGDPISMVGALRSPLFAVPDTDLYALGVGRPRAFARFGATPLPTSASAHLRRAWEQFSRLRALRDRVPVSALLRHILSEGAAWHAYALDGDFGQAEANALRLVEMAARFDSRGPEGLETVADWFATRVEDAEREEEATVLPTAARVVMMTVHAAKGLEFPVVIVPQAGSATHDPWAPLLVRRVGDDWEMACRVPEPAPAGTCPGARSPRRLVSPGLHARLAALRAAQEAAEDRRLLYVAATRARDHLVFVGRARGGGAAAGSWLHLLEGTGADARGGVRVRRLEDLEGLEVAPLHRTPSPPAPGADARARLSAVPAPLELEISPSGLDLFERCPARWVLRHLLRLPEETHRAEHDGSRDLAALRGDVIHSLLEDDVADDPAVARARWSARARAAGVSPKEVGRSFHTLWSHLERASGDPSLRAILAAEGMAEVGFRIPFGRVVLRGQIDRLWFDRAAGEWVVLDYKSEAVSHGPLVAAARHERQVRAYAWAASRILRAHGHPAVHRGMLYFTALGEAYHYPRWDEGDFEALEALLGEVAEIAVAPWEEVEERTIASTSRRPCDACAYLGRGCRGQAAAVPRVPPRV